MWMPVLETPVPHGESDLISECSMAYVWLSFLSKCVFKFMVPSGENVHCHCPGQGLLGWCCLICASG